MQIVNVWKIKFTFRYNKPLGSYQKEIQQNYINLSNISPLLLLELVITQLYEYLCHGCTFFYSKVTKPKKKKN